MRAAAGAAWLAVRSIAPVVVRVIMIRFAVLVGSTMPEIA